MNTQQQLNAAVPLSSATSEGGKVPVRPPPPRSRVFRKQRKQQMQEKTFTLLAKEMGALTDARCQHLRQSLKATYGIYMDVDRPNRRITLNGLTSLASDLTKAEREVKEMAHSEMNAILCTQKRSHPICPKPPRPPPPTNKQQSTSEQLAPSRPVRHGTFSEVMETTSVEAQSYLLLPQPNSPVEVLPDILLQTQTPYDDQQTHPSPLTHAPPPRSWPTHSDVLVKSKVHQPDLMHQSHSASMPVLRRKYKFLAKEMKVLDSDCYQLRETLNRKYSIDMVVDRRKKTVILVGPTTAARFFRIAQNEIERCVHRKPARSCQLECKGQSVKPPRPPPPTVQPQARNKPPQAIHPMSQDCRHHPNGQRRQHMHAQVQTKKFKLSPRVMTSLTDSHCQQLHQTLMDQFNIEMEVNREKYLIALKGLTSAAPCFLKAENEVKRMACHQLMMQQGLTQEPTISPQCSPRPIHHSNTVPPSCYPMQQNQLKSALQQAPSGGKPPRPPPPRPREQVETLVPAAGGKKTPPPRPPPAKPCVAWEQEVTLVPAAGGQKTRPPRPPPPKRRVASGRVGSQASPLPAAGRQRSLQEQVQKKTVKLSPKEAESLSDSQCQQLCQVLMEKYDIDMEVNYKKREITLVGLTSRAPFFTKAQSEVRKMVCGGLLETKDSQATQASKASPGAIFRNPHLSHPPAQMHPQQTSQPLPAASPVASPCSAAKGGQNHPPRPPPPTKRGNITATSSVVTEQQMSSIRIQAQAKTFKLPAKQIAALTKPWCQRLTQTLSVKYNLRMEVDRKKKAVTLHGLTSAAPYFTIAQTEIRRTASCLLDVKEELMFVPPVVASGKRNPASSQFNHQQSSPPVLRQQLAPSQPLRQTEPGSSERQACLECSPEASFSPLIPNLDVHEEVPEYQDNFLPNSVSEGRANGSLPQSLEANASTLALLPPPLIPLPLSCDQKKSVKLSRAEMTALSESHYHHIRQTVKENYNINLEVDRKERKLLLSGPTSAAKYFTIAEKEVRGQLQTSKEITYNRHIGLVLGHSDYPSRIQKIAKDERVKLKYLPKPQWGIRLDGNQAAVCKAETAIKSTIRGIEIDEDQLQASSTYLPAFPSPEFRSLRQELEKSLAVICQYPDIVSLPKTSEEQPAAVKVSRSVTIYKWSWENDSGSFTPYPDDVSKSLTHAFLSSSTHEHTFQTNGNKVYKVDFQNMLQVNATTGYTRKVQCEQLVEEEEEPEENGEDDILSFFEPAHLVITVRGLRKNLPIAKSRIREELLKASMTRQLGPLSFAPTLDLKSKVREIAEEYAVSYRIEKVSTPGSAEEKWALVVGGLQKAVLVAQEKMLPEILSFQSSGNASIQEPRAWQRQVKTVELFDVRPGMAEYNNVADRVKETLPRANISRIRRIQNRWLWEKHSQQERRLHVKNKGQVNEKMLFHGTRGNDPKLIYDSEEGFDMRYSEAGMWGLANYFAVNASYSHCYAHPASDGSKSMFLARVLTGDSYTSSPNNSLRMPPKKEQDSSSGGKVCLSEMSYDTVNGRTAGSTVYMTYDNHSAYPAYLIEYR